MPRACRAALSGIGAGIRRINDLHAPWRPEHKQRAPLEVAAWPAWLFGLLWLGFNLLGSQDMLSGHVAYMAHLGGFFFGLLLSALVLKHAR